MNLKMRIGFGYDLHRLARRKKFLLGGIEVDFPKGFLAHSDGDVLLHALIDGLLGAMALGDIGKHFPDTDPVYKNVSSSVLLQRTLRLVEEHHYEIGNIDFTIVCQRPRLAGYITQIREKLSDLTGVSVESISVKAKTKEKVDAVGKGKAVEVFCSILLCEGWEGMNK